MIAVRIEGESGLLKKRRRVGVTCQEFWRAFFWGQVIHSPSSSMIPISIFALESKHPFRGAY